MHVYSDFFTLIFKGIEIWKRLHFFISSRDWVRVPQ